MERTPVTSSYLEAIGYSYDARVLEAEFRAGGVYQYDGVPENRYEGLMRASSKGRYFRAHIKDRFPTRKVG